MASAKINIQRLVETDEYRVSWYIDGKYDEAKSSYTTTKEDAVGTLLHEKEWARSHGFTLEPSNQFTQKMVMEIRGNGH